MKYFIALFCDNGFPQSCKDVPSETHKLPMPDLGVVMCGACLLWHLSLFSNPTHPAFVAKWNIVEKPVDLQIVSAACPNYSGTSSSFLHLKPKSQHEALFVIFLGATHTPLFLTHILQLLCLLVGKRSEKLHEIL
jgi:hypothetical protein